MKQYFVFCERSDIFREWGMKTLNLNEFVYRDADRKWMSEKVQYVRVDNDNPELMRGYRIDGYLVLGLNSPSEFVLGSIIRPMMVFTDLEEKL